MNDILNRIPAWVWPLLVLALWITVAVTTGLLRFTPYGLEEGAARALLLNWSTSAQMAVPIFFHGQPDLRALLFIPLGIYWTGSLVAARVFALIMMAIAIWGLYRWSRLRFNEETALLASGLMIIGPLTLMQINLMGAGLFALLLLALGRWVDMKYRSHTERTINSWYFVQILLICTSVTLHPVGLAYPAALAWNWYRNPLSEKHRRHVFIGIVIGCGIMLATGLGWAGLSWFSNPALSLAHMVYSFYPAEPIGDNGMVIGTLVLIALLMVVALCRREFSADLLGQGLLAGLALGLLSADTSWALFAQTVLFYGGVQLLTRVNDRLPLQSFTGQRGLTMAVLFVAMLWFMQMDKAQAHHIANNILGPEDQLIEQLSLQAQDPNQPFTAASEWPSRTMLAVRRDVLPLPPAMKDSEQLWDNIKSMTHLMFSHTNPDNHQLGQQLSALTDVTKTLIIDSGGVIVLIEGDADKVHPGATPPSAPPPAATGSDPDQPLKPGE